MISDLSKRTHRIRQVAQSQSDRYHELNDRWKSDRRDWKPDEILEVAA